MEIKLDAKYSAWVYRIQEGFGVAVELPAELKFSEKFASAKIYTRTENIGGVSRNFLVLQNAEESLRNEFAWICEKFCLPGEGGIDRNELISSPSEWWRRMSDLLGNAVRNKTPLNVLGELVVYLRLLNSNAVGVSWQGGPANQSHDLETSSVDYEVKSSSSRKTAITVTGQHQLEVQGNKVLKLLFCRFEKVDGGGYSINSVVAGLKQHPVDQHELEQKLAKLGLEEGCTAREVEYRMDDVILSYTVDGNFPKITATSFVGGKFPDQVMQLSYKLDLAVLSSEIFNP